MFLSVFGGRGGVEQNGEGASKSSSCANHFFTNLVDAPSIAKNRPKKKKNKGTSLKIKQSPGELQSFRPVFYEQEKKNP